MSDVKLPENVEAALAGFEEAISDGNDLTGFMQYSIGCDLDNLRRAIAAALHRRAADSYSDTGLHHSCEVCQRAESGLRAQADALDKEPPHGESR